MDDIPTVSSLYSFSIALCMRLNRTLMVSAAQWPDLFNRLLWLLELCHRKVSLKPFRRFSFSFFLFFLS